MTLLVNFVLLAVGVFVLVRYLRYRSRIFLVLLVLLGLAAGAYNSVRTFANLAVDEAFIENVARTHRDIKGYEYDAEDMVFAERPPLDFNQSNGNFDRVIDIEVPHPWNEYTSFNVDIQFLVRDHKIISVLFASEGHESFLFSGFTWGPDWLPFSRRLMSRDSLREYNGE